MQNFYIPKRTTIQNINKIQRKNSSTGDEKKRLLLLIFKEPLKINDADLQFQLGWSHKDQIYPPTSNKGKPGLIHDTTVFTVLAVRFCKTLGIVTDGRPVLPRQFPGCSRVGGPGEPTVAQRGGGRGEPREIRRPEVTGQMVWEREGHGGVQRWVAAPLQCSTRGLISACV